MEFSLRGHSSHTMTLKKLFKENFSRSKFEMNILLKAKKLGQFFWGKRLRKGAFNKDE